MPQEKLQPGRQLAPLGPDDFPRVAPLVRRFYAHFGYPYSARVQGRSFRQLLADPARGRAWLVTAGGAPAGYVVLTLGWSIEYGGRVAMVDELFVEAAHRGAGLGTWVLERMKAEAGKMGVRRLFLEVESYNRRAKALYVRCGYDDRRRALMSRALTPRPATPARRSPGGR